MSSTIAATEQVNSRDENGKELTPDLLKRFRADFDSSRSNRLMQNAVTQTIVSDVALNRSVVTTTDHTFSHLLDDWTVTNQKKSGRCWMFAGLNLLRVGAMEQMNLKEFEFSQNYTLFWDKLERANFFLEAIIEMANRPVDDRTVARLLDYPLNDGGQWNMFVNVIKKHGLVPKSAMPETESSSNTARMNEILLAKLREGARTLRALAEGQTNSISIADAKCEILETIHRILCITSARHRRTLTGSGTTKTKNSRATEKSRRSSSQTSTFHCRSMIMSVSCTTHESLVRSVAHLLLIN